jgi:general secretion pathway protein L
MSDTLVIRLVGDAAEWVVVDASGALLDGPERLASDAPGPTGSGRRVVALVPSRQVYRTRVDVPVKGPAKVLQALPFALEDQLADEVDELHFAAGLRDDTGKVEVAVVRRAALDDWCQRLANLGLVPAAVQADSDGLADVPATATLLLETDQMILRTGEADPLVAEAEDAPVLVGLWLDQRVAGREEPPPPANLLVFAGTDEARLLDGIEALRPRLQSLELRQLVGGALPRLAAGVIARPGVNLLQGSYSPRRSLAGVWPRWRLAASLAAAALVAAIGVVGLEAWRLQREADALAATVATAVRYTFPDAGAGADPRALLDSRLAQSGAAAGPAVGDEFLPTLKVLAEAIAQSGDAQLESLSYRAGVFDLQVRAPSAATLDKIRQFVTADGTRTAEIQSANAEGDQVQGRIRVAVPAAASRSAPTGGGRA